MEKKPTYEELEQRIRDLERGKSAEKRLCSSVEDQESMYRLILESISDTIIVTDDQGNMLYVCPNTTFIFGLSQDQVYNQQTIQRLMNGTVCDISELKNQHEIKDIEWSITNSYGKTRCLLINAKSVSINGGTVLYVMHDITERKQAEEALRESEDKFKHVFDHSIIGKSITFPSGEMQTNKAFYEMLGYSKEEFLDFKWQQITHPDDVELSQRVVDSLLSGEKDSDRFIKRYFHKNGSVVWANVSTVLRRDKEENPLYLMATISNITERKQTEEALKISRENLLEESNQRKILSKRLIDLLEKDRHDIAMELHDNIGQILTSLKINLEVIDDKLKPIDTELGSLTKDAIKRANQAINDLHNIAQGLMPSILDALGLVSSLRALLNEFREHTDIKIKFFNRNVPKRFDQEKELAIYRIVQEALNNIIKHAKAKNVHVSLLKKGSVLFLSVEDDGVGFDQDKKMKISKGKGPLGLVIMRERAMQLDGELTVESSLGKGTHLLAEIPI